MAGVVVDMKMKSDDKNKALEAAIGQIEKAFGKRRHKTINKIVSLPQGFISFFTSSFLSIRGKLRLGMEPFLPRLKNNPEDESMGAFVKRRLGQEALDYAANPFIGGIYASRPESLILKHAFPNLQQLEEKYGN